MVIKREKSEGASLQVQEKKILGRSGMKEVDAMVAAVKKLTATHTRMWEQWKVIGHGLAAGRKLIQELNPGIVIPSGQYSRKMSEWLAMHKITDKMISAAERAALLNIMEELPEIDRWRKEDLPGDEQRKVSHPERVWQKWKARMGTKKKRKSTKRFENPEADAEAVQEMRDDLQAAQDRVQQLEEEADGKWLKWKAGPQRIFRKLKRELRQMPATEYLELGELIVEDAKARLGETEEKEAA